jgi:gamma-glutamyltranspeptidase/glutathione hydrolase
MRHLLVLAAFLAFASPAASQRQMVAAAHPLAAEAGMEMLRAGGTAVDAAVAVQLVLGLVEPQSSGIGGGAFLVHRTADGRLRSFDGRETAPAYATPDLFLTPEGGPMAFYDAVVGGRSVGVPGAVAMLFEAHRAQGRLPWAKLFEPAIRLAEQGFAVSPRLARAIAAEGDRLKRDAAARGYFFLADGAPLPAGHLLRNEEYAHSLRLIAAQGPEPFYRGEIAERIVAAVQGASWNPGRMTASDLAGYRPAERPVVCGAFRLYRVCGMGPPSSGGIAVAQILGLMDHFALPAREPFADIAHVGIEAGKLAFADRAAYVGDPEFVPVPSLGLLDPAYLTARAQLIDPDRAGTPRAGNPPWRRAAYEPAESFAEEAGTSHLSIVDRFGNAVSMTTTVEDAFGARIMAAGFILNNQLTDFAFAPEQDGRLVANRVEGRKRPRSSMAPTIVERADGGLHAVVGSPGGARIIGYVAKTLVGLLAWNLDAQEAIDLPNVLTVGTVAELEQGTEAASFAPALEARGQRVQVRVLESGVQAIVVTQAGLRGGADRRREGVALGE